MYLVLVTPGTGGNELTNALKWMFTHVYGMKPVAFRLPEPMRERVEEYADQMGESKSIAGRELLRTAFEAQEEIAALRQENDELRTELEDRRASDKDSIKITKPTVVSMMGFYLIALVITVDSGTLLTGLGISLILISAVYSVITNRPT